MYKVNDVIIYGAQGACRIEGIEEKKVCGKTDTYYVLVPVDSATCRIYAPKETSEKKMRRILSADEIHEIIRSMPDEDALWIENENERKEKYRSIIAEGDRKELIRMIKAIYLRKKELRAAGRKLHTSDEKFFKEAERILYNEFAVVLKIKQGEVLSFITESLK